MTNLSLIIPLYNESGRIKTLDNELRRFMRAAFPLRYELVLVNDGSTDDTGTHLNKLKREYRDNYTDARLEIKVIHLKDNIGKGGALKAGVLASRGRWVLTLDADMATKATQVLDWSKANFIDLGSSGNHSDAIYIGSREHPESVVSDKPYRRLLGRGFNFLVQVINNIYTEDTQCGFKLYPRHIALHCFENLTNFGWAHDVEILMRLSYKGYRFISLPVQWEAVFPSNVKPLKDAFRMFAALLKIRRITRRLERQNRLRCAATWRPVSDRQRFTQGRFS